MAAANAKPTSYGWHRGCSATSPRADGLLSACSRCGELNSNLAQAWGECPKAPIYRDPVTPDGFCCLWDGLVASGWRVDITTLADGYLAQVYKKDERGLIDLATIYQGGSSSRNIALIQAAANALGLGHLLATEED